MRHRDRCCHGSSTIVALLSGIVAAVTLAGAVALGMVFSSDDRIAYAMPPMALIIIFSLAGRAVRRRRIAYTRIAAVVHGILLISAVFWSVACARPPASSSSSSNTSLCYIAAAQWMTTSLSACAAIGVAVSD